MREPSRIAFAGDWHGNTYWASNTVEEVALLGVDTIVHTGDYGFMFSSNFIATVEQACAECDVMIYFVEGNHDKHYWIWERPLDEDGFHIISEHVRAIPRGHRWQWWGKTFMGLGGAASVDKQYRSEGRDWWETEEITPDDVARAIEGGKVDVLVTHDCPAGVNIPGIIPGDYTFWGKEAIDRAERHRQVLYQVWDAVRPRLLVHGHYHTHYYTRFFDSMVVGLDMDGTTFDTNILTLTSVLDLE